MTFLERLDATNGSGGPDCHWRFGDAPGATMAARIGGVNGAWANITDLEFQADPLTANAAGGKSIAFGAAGTDPGHGTITLGTGGVTVAGQQTFHMRVQLDAAAA